MHSWEVVCVDRDPDREFDDCRAIEEVGFLAPSLREESANTVAARIHQDHSNFHITVDGEQVQLEAQRDPDVFFYPRTLEEDSPDDPLLALPPCNRYERDQKFAGKR